MERNDLLAHINEHWQEYGYSAKPDKYTALTFDDGPCPPSDSGGTAALLETLDVLKVKATFFAVGGNVHNNKAVTRSVFEAGHELANHSQDHRRFGGEAADAIRASLAAASAEIKEITGTAPRLFRAPYLDHGDNLSRVCAEMGMPLIDGDDHNDWHDDSEAIKNSVIAKARDGGIILLHDNNTSCGNTMSVLPDIVAELRKKGFWITTVSNLAAIKGKTLRAGRRYGNLA